MYRPTFSSIIHLLKLFLIIHLSWLVASCTTTTTIKQDKAEIAILMPLTGPSGEEGKKLAELIKLGLEDNLQGFVSITTLDVATDDLIKQAALKMQANDTRIILGPLFTPSVKSLEQFAKEHDILMLTLSNNPMLGDENRIFVFGHAPLKQINRMLSYLFDKDHKEFALLLPANKTSINLNKFLSEIIKANGGVIIACEQYVQTPESIDMALHKITLSVDQVIENIDNEIKPVVIFAEENHDSLQEIFKVTKAYNLDSKAIIAGDGRIDIDYPEPINYLFTGSRRNIDEKVLERSKNLGLHHLSFLQNLAYDLGAVTAQAIGVSYSQSSFLSRFKSPVWYQGLSGDLKVNGSLIERKYSIIAKEGNSYRIIDPLPINIEHITDIKEN